LFIIFIQKLNHLNWGIVFSGGFSQLAVLFLSLASHADGLAIVPMPDAVPSLSCVGSEEDDGKEN